MDRDTNEDRQEDELQFLKEVYDAIDLRSDDPWKVRRPPEYSIELHPDDTGTHPSLKLTVRYPVNYPDEAPHLQLAGLTKDITDDQLKELRDEIEKIARDKVGREVMFDIIHHLEDFLRDLSQPPVSLHEEMVIRHRQEVDEQKRKDEERRLQSERERREIEAQIQEQQKRRHRDNQLHTSLQKQPALNKVEEEDDVFNEVDGQTDVNHNPIVSMLLRQDLHSNSPSMNRKPVVVNGDINPVRDRAPIMHTSPIHRGKCIGHSDNGYSVYIGMDSNTGDLVAVYEWVLRCRQSKNDVVRRQRQIASIRSELEELQHQRHPHLVQYLNMKDYISDCNTITVEILMEYVGGGSMSCHLRSSSALPINLDCLRLYTRQLLGVVYYLHSNGIVHKDLKLASILLDSIGHLKLAGTSIIKRLCDLHKTVNQQRPASSSAADDDHLINDPVAWAETKGGKKGDILKLGLVILCMALGQTSVSYPPVIPANFCESLKDFIMKCIDPNEYTRHTVKQLLEHPFVQQTNIMRSPSESFLVVPSESSNDLCKKAMTLFRRDSVTGTPIVPKNLVCSRLRTEFEEIEFLGKGGFGDVVMVRNHLDGKIYAIKRIELHKENKQMYKKITREVRLLSNLNHENVVRYFNSWIETYVDSGNDLKNQKSNSLEEETSSEEEDYEEDDDDELDDDQFSDSSTEGARTGTLSRSSSHDSFITFEASHDSDGEVDLSALDDTFTTSDPLASIDSDLAITKFLDSSDAVIFKDSTSNSQKVARKMTVRSQHRPPPRPGGPVHYLYIQMEYCEKNTLRQVIDTGELHKNNEEVWRLFRELVEGLAHIHSRDVIHRDLKPGNIFLSSSGHVKIGDFGLAISHKFLRQSSILVPDSSIMEHSHQEVTGPVGTALYTSPEVLYSTGPAATRYSDKVDIYSMGIIFFEMCHAPWDTQMERYEVLLDLRKEDMSFPLSFDEVANCREAAVIRMLLEHDPRDRPSSKELISKYLPVKMEEADFAHALEQTMSMPQSTRYQQLLDNLFSQQVSTRSEVLYSLDKGKFSMQMTTIQHEVHRIISKIFTRHGAILLKTPLLLLKDPVYDDSNLHTVHLMDKSGSLVMLPYDLRVPFARYVYNHDVTFLKRYTISRVFRENKLNGAHPRELFECAYDIITPSSGSFLPDAEVIYVVSEVLAQFPELLDQNYKVLLTHTNLLSAILKHCSIASDMREDIFSILHGLITGVIRGSQLEEKFIELGLSTGSIRQLLNFVKSEVPIDEARFLLEPLFSNRSAVDGSVTAWQEIETVMSHLRSLGIKEMVYLHLGLVPHFKYFSGIIFQYSGSVTKSRSKRAKTVVLAAGGRYDELVKKGKSELSAVGVSISAETIFSAVAVQSRISGSDDVCSRCSVLVCWTGQVNFQKKCIELVRQLWDNDVRAEILYDSLQMDTIGDIQEFCSKNLIHYIVIFDDVYSHKKLVHLWTMIDKSFTDKTVNISEVVDRVLYPERFDQDKCSTTDIVTATTTVSTSRSNILSSSSENSTTTSSTVNITAVNVVHFETGKMPVHQKRKYQDQAYSKVHTALQKIGVRSAEILIVELKADALSTVAAEVNKLIQSENNDVNISQLKTVTESLENVSRKYLNRVLEAITKSLSEKRSPVIVLFSSSTEHYQLILDIP